KTVVEANLRSQYGLNIIAVENAGKVTEIVGPQYKFRKDDILFLAGSKEGLMKMSEWTNTQTGSGR
ncbi:MAG: TrkA C-terminal domain-containing protein, partial [Clostridiales bacterium]|nr:TrkA C-terminal domain-containing protein [Clostridiales bacterium]